MHAQEQFGGPPRPAGLAPSRPLSKRRCRQWPIAHARLIRSRARVAQGGVAEVRRRAEVVPLSPVAAALIDRSDRRLLPAVATSIHELEVQRGRHRNPARSFSGDYEATASSSSMFNGAAHLSADPMAPRSTSLRARSPSTPGKYPHLSMCAQLAGEMSSGFTRRTGALSVETCKLRPMKPGRRFINGVLPEAHTALPAG
eukprot:CAMPEP_0170296612 /NCGR_PEP_ID=MMETSP0116_2-20130129/48456_1 /TAXON_ID=400756 /ORGANISM="Durinskia baltica, Strain CSIRO CS-38" /LENGTH=199 /DNA_ID=CAMNT_0010548215 /DNA_START=95 /DNA_END=691 /DNA_ORIENTATION=-